MIFASKITSIKFLYFFSSVSTSKCLDLFKVTLSLIFFNLVLKSVFAIKFALANFAVKTPTAKLLILE